MFAILAEDRSDFLTLKEIIWKLCGDKSLAIKGRGFGSGSELLKDGARELKALLNIGTIKSVIVCHDADDYCANKKHEEIYNKVIRPVVRSESEAVSIVPISMIESWILADINACRKVFLSLPAQKEVVTPESCRQPKNEIERVCKNGAKPRYSNATHNQLIAPHLDLKKIYQRCPSFRPLTYAVDEIYLGKRRDAKEWK
ncbi:DUF4276 family protein [Delftia acidovorans]|uniref:DUF4276 family protein n=1 Tax=Delftia acidovorans TaxID=80866 RepID=UPI002FDEB3DB